MKIRCHALFVFGQAAVMALAVGCEHKGPPPKTVSVAAPPPAPVPPPPPAPPPPPEPTCVALDEKCTAAEDTWVAIGDSGYVFRPPTGWTYAKESEQSVAVVASGEASVAITELESTSNEAVLSTMERLFERLEVERVAEKWFKGRLAKPDTTVDAGELKVDLWEIGDRQQFGKSPKLRGELDGTALVFKVPLSADRALLGAAFASVNEADAAPKIMSAVQTLKKETPDGPAPPASPASPAAQ